jgi:hypothetical protein
MAHFAPVPLALAVAAALMVALVPARGEGSGPLNAVPLSSRSPEGWFTPPPNRIEVGPPRQVRTERLDATNQPHLTPEGAELVRLYVGEASTIAITEAGALAGAELPDHVELRPFPADLVARVPRLGARAYVTAGETIVLVDPETGRIGQVLKP